MFLVCCCASVRCWSAVEPQFECIRVHSDSESSADSRRCSDCRYRSVPSRYRCETNRVRGVLPRYYLQLTTDCCSYSGVYCPPSVGVVHTMVQHTATPQRHLRGRGDRRHDGTPDAVSIPCGYHPDTLVRCRILRTHHLACHSRCVRMSLCWRSGTVSVRHIERYRVYHDWTRGPTAVCTPSLSLPPAPHTAHEPCGRC